MKQLLLPMEKVKKSNAICRARWSPENIYEPRIVSLLASQIRPEDVDFKEYEIPVTKLFANIYGGDNYKKLKSTVENLMSKTITILEENNSYKVFPLFSGGEYNSETNILKISINSRIKHHFLDLQTKYTQYNLMEFLTLSSTYSQRLFEYLKSWEDCESTQITIDELHKILGVPDNYKTNFAQFKRKALEPALKEINKKTSLEYSWKPIKFKNKVAQILFINSKPQKETQDQPKNQEEPRPSAHQQPKQPDFKALVKQMAEEKRNMVEEAKKNKA